MPVRMTLLLATILSRSALLPPAAPVEPNSPVRSMLVFMSWNTFSMMSTSLLANIKSASARIMQKNVWHTACHHGVAACITGPCCLLLGARLAA